MKSFICGNLDLQSLSLLLELLKDLIKLYDAGVYFW